MAAPVDPSEAATFAFLAYLRMEADLSEQKAKTFRAQADQLAITYGITYDLQERFELGPEAAPPLDENGIPKYRGKKRGRKPKERKRKANPNRRKRQHTAYTLFVQERYPVVRSEHPEWQSKEVISVIAKLWAEVPKEEKRTWKERALSTVESEVLVSHGDDDDEVDEEDVDEDDEEEEKEEARMVMHGHAEGTASAAEFEEDENEHEEDHNEDLAVHIPSSNRRRRR